MSNQAYPRPTAAQITVAKKVLKADHCSKEHKKQWEKLYALNNFGRIYGNNPNKTSSKIGKNASHHILDSAGIRSGLASYTPRNAQPIIPASCHLSFHLGRIAEDGQPIINNLDMSPYTPVHDPQQLSFMFDNRDRMARTFDTGLYTTKLIVSINEEKHSFYVKSLRQSGSAFAKCFSHGAEYIMRYRQAIAIELGDFMMLLTAQAGTNALIGAGFCNLAGDKPLQGHQMLHLFNETMHEVNVQFSARREHLGWGQHHRIAMEVMTYQKKKKKFEATLDEPLQLFEWITPSNEHRYSPPPQDAVGAMKPMITMETDPSLPSLPLPMPQMPSIVPSYRPVHGYNHAASPHGALQLLDYNAVGPPRQWDYVNIAPRAELNQTPHSQFVFEERSEPMQDPEMALADSVFDYPLDMPMIPSNFMGSVATSAAASRIFEPEASGELIRSDSSTSPSVGEHACASPVQHRMFQAAPLMRQGERLHRRVLGSTRDEMRRARFNPYF